MSSSSGSSVSRSSGPTNRTDSIEALGVRLEAARRVDDGQPIAKHEQVEQPSHVNVVSASDALGRAAKAEVPERPAGRRSHNSGPATCAREAGSDRGASVLSDATARRLQRSGGQPPPWAHRIADHNSRPLAANLGEGEGQEILRSGGEHSGDLEQVRREPGMVVGKVLSVAANLRALALDLPAELIAGVVQDADAATGELGDQRQRGIDVPCRWDVEKDDPSRVRLPFHAPSIASADLSSCCSRSLAR